ncbi:hypothetical protein BJX65DRAFT_305692 [Aspergillus insuetus]
MPASNNPPYLRRRAGVVCVQCHIKCDLQQRQAGPCTNCNKTGQTCQRRRGLRKEGKPRRYSSPAAQSPVVQPQLESPDNRDTNANTTIPSPTKPRNQFLGYLAEGSFLSNTCGPEADGVEPVVPALAERALLVGESALALPASPLLDAFIDAYFVNLFPLLPVVDRSDVTGDDRSILLLQCLSLLGSHFRYRRPPSISSPGCLYAKVKSLLDQNYERDPLTTLKALCLIACRSAESPTVVSLDSPWHWLGVATRYALSMGLHREATYHTEGGPRLESVGGSGGISLYNQDKLQSLCYGRPPAVRLYEIDVEPPTLRDFSIASPDNEVFLQRTKLCILLGKVSDAQYGRHQRSLLEEATNIGQYLKQWIEELPADLRLYPHTDPSVRSPYRRAVSELHVMYFTGIILFYRLVESPQDTFTSLKVSVVAASCIVHLLMEIYYRDEVPLLLPINNWYATVASVPLISAQAKLPEDGAIRREELEMLRLVLREMLPTSPSTQLIMNNIDRMERLVLGAPGEPGPTHPRQPPPAVERPATPSSPDGLSWTQFRPLDPSLLFPFDASLFQVLHCLKDLSNEVANYAAPPGSMNMSADGEGATILGLEEQHFSFNFDFADVQLDEYSMAFGDADMASFDQVLLA